MTRTRIETGDAPHAMGPYRQGLSSGDLVFCSGQIGLDPATGKLPDGFEAQVERAMRNIGGVLEAAGLGYGNIVKTTLFLTDISQFQVVNAIYKTVLKEPFPARSTIGVAALPGGATFEIEAIAMRDGG